MSEGALRINSGRLVLIIMLVSVCSLIIHCRLIQQQVFQHQELLQLALKQHEVDKLMLPARGTIYDSHLDELASSVTVSTIVAAPGRLRDIAAAVRSLAPLLELDPQELLAEMNDPHHREYLVVKRRIDPKVEPKIEALGIDGIYLMDDSMRVYPNQALASHALGFVNMDGRGTAGLEMEYDNELKGTRGRLAFNVDARHRSFRGKVLTPPVPGRSLVLSIDRTIQYITEKELAAGVQKSQAAAGVAIVMEPGTGRILALANYPNFNSNTYGEYPSDQWRNRAVQDMFEPGSTAKVVVASAALDAGLIRPGELIDCQMGSMTVANHVFHDHQPYGLLTFSQILEYSSNIGAAKLGTRLGDQRLYAALRTFGLGSRTGIDLPAEITGWVHPVKDWSALSVAAISFGQEVGVTSMQMLVAINAIANGGYRVRPSVVDRVIGTDGNVIRVRPPERSRIMRPETAAEVMDAFEGVVLRGTGKRAALLGYRAAGKTGTAQKADGNHFSKTKYTASFIGFAPLPQPRVTILVQLDEPKGVIYGGDVAAPVFQKIAQQAMIQLGIPPDKSLLVSPGLGRGTGR